MLTQMTEALRILVDTLQWVNQLRAENWKLKEENLEASQVATLEAKLERSRGDVARVTEWVRVCKKEVASERTPADAVSRTREEEATKLSEMQEQLREPTV